MNYSKRSKFFHLPETKMGWWSGILSILAIVMILVSNLGLNPIEQFSGNLFSILIKAYDVIIFASMVTSIVLGIIALSAKRDRSWITWLFMIPLFFLVFSIVWMILERSRYAMETTPMQHPETTMELTPLIFDDDGSPDGTSALLYLLAEPNAKIMSVSVSYGEAHPQVYIHHLGGMLERFGYGEIPLGFGEDLPLAGDNSFPEQVREASNVFWGFANEQAQKQYPTRSSADLIIDTVMGADEPVTLFLSGALTNLAQALRMEPRIGENIKAVYIMGGAVYASGNLEPLLPDSENLAAEWNIYVDPLAASEVFTSRLNLYLVPLDATNQLKLTKKDTAAWRKGGSIADFAADFNDSLMQSWGSQQIEIWDLMTAAIMMHPESCKFTPLRLEVVTEEGNTEGQTRVVDGESNVQVCLEPDTVAIKQIIASVFSSRK